MSFLFNLSRAGKISLSIDPGCHKVRTPKDHRVRLSQLFLWLAEGFLKLQGDEFLNFEYAFSTLY